MCIPTCFKTFSNREATASRRSPQRSICSQNMENRYNDDNNVTENRSNDHSNVVENRSNDDNNSVNIEVEHDRCTFQVRKYGTEFL